jgi:hypothetical protein
MSGAPLASLAIFCSFVETLVGLGIPGIFPSKSSAIRPPLPSTGSAWCGVPRLLRYYRRLRLPVPLPVELRFSSLAGTVLALCVRYRGYERDRRGPGLDDRGAPTGSGRRTQDLPGSWATPMCTCPALRPRRASAPGLRGASVLPSALKTASAPQTVSFRGSITRPVHSLCTLRRPGYPGTTQHSVPAAANLTGQG